MHWLIRIKQTIRERAELRQACDRALLWACYADLLTADDMRAVLTTRTLRTWSER